MFDLFNNCNNHIDGVDNVLVFLENQWNKLYGAGNISSDTIKAYNGNTVAHEIMDNITSILNGINHSGYPYYKITNNAIEVNYDKVHNHAMYALILKQIDLLIWAVSKTHHNDFGLFIAEWNYIMSLEHNHTSIRKVVASICKYQGSSSNFKDWNVIGIESYKDANSRLISDCINNVVPNNHSEALILDFVVNHVWNTLITRSVYNDSAENTVLNHSSEIAQKGTSDITVLNFLKHFNIVSGTTLQKKLVKGIGYNNDFKKARGYAIAISKINNPKSMFYFNKQNPWTIHHVSGNEIIKAIKAHKNVHKKYQKLINKKDKIDNQLKHMQHRFTQPF